MATKILKIRVVHVLLLIKCVYSYQYTDYADYFENNPNFIETEKNKDFNQNKVKEGVSSLSEHTMVSDSTVFPYMACVMRGARYLASGALVDASWVLTSADGLFLMGESIRFLRVRLGSINYKKGGIVSRVKLFEIHPYFDDNRPNYDLALIMLAQPVRFTPDLKPIRLQLVPKEVAATHLIVTSWPGPLQSKPNRSNILSMEVIKRQRILTVTHLHPSDLQECKAELQGIGASEDGVMCLEATVKDPCLRDVGAPVVLNQILWAVISSWKPDDCADGDPGPVFATVLSARNVSTWIHATVHGHSWTERPERKMGLDIEGAGSPLS